MSVLINKFLKLQSTKHNNLFEAAKKLDKVGKEDADIDNDGDVDSSDKYLHNRRKAIKKAMEENVIQQKSGNPIPPTAAQRIRGDGEEAPKFTGKQGSTNQVTPSDKKELDKKIGDVVKEAAQIDEVSKDLLGKYLSKADPMPQPGKPMPEAPTGKRREGARLARAKIGARPKEFGNPKVMGTGPDALDRAMEKVAKAFPPGMLSKKKAQNEEVDFSEEELAHFAAVFEAGPVAPTPNDYAGKKDGPSVRDLTDETEVPVKRGRGRPVGSKSGSKHGEEEKAEPMRVAAQIRTARPSFDGNVEKVSITHPETGKVHRVPQHAALQFNKDYAAAEKPAHKDAIEAAFIKKHMS